MRKKLLLLCACFFGALLGAKAWTSVEPEVGKSYYLHCTVYPDQFWTASKADNRYSITKDLSAAIPVYVESISCTTYALSFYVDGTKYYLHHFHEDYDWPTTFDTMDLDGDADGYCIRNDSYTDWFKSGHRYMWPSESEGICTWDQVLDQDAEPDYCWQFIPAEEMMPYMSAYCAGVAEANFVTGWERVESVEELKNRPENYFFAIFSANAAARMLDTRTDVNEEKPRYQEAVNPSVNAAYLFEFDTFNGDLVLKSSVNNKYFENRPRTNPRFENDGPWNYHADYESLDNNSLITVTYADGAFDIQTANTDEYAGNYLGLWTPGNGYLAGEILAGNKVEGEKGSFLIYRTPKKNIDMTGRTSTTPSDWVGVGKQTPVQPYQDGVETYNSNVYPFEVGDVLYQTVKNLPNGYYELVFNAWENFADWEESGIPYGEGIAQIFANDAAQDIYVIKDMAGREWDDNKYTLCCYVTDGTLKYGVRNITQGGNWAVCRPLSLTYVGANPEIIEDGDTQTYVGVFAEDAVLVPTVTYPIVNISDAIFNGEILVNFDENPNGLIVATAAQKAKIGATVKNVIVDGECDALVLTEGYRFAAPADFTAKSASYSRPVAVSDNYGAICLPYNVESNDDIQYYTVESVADGVLTVDVADAVEAGVPAIFMKKNAEAESIVVTTENATVVSAVVEQTGESTLVGTFDGVTVSGELVGNSYYVKNDKCWRGVESFYIGSFGAYLVTANNDDASLDIVVRGSAVNTLKALDEKQTLKDGKYLIGGKIIVVNEGRKFGVNGVIQ